MSRHWHTQRGVYHAANPTYRANEPNSLVHQLAQAGHVHVFGYRAENMSAGFGISENVDLLRGICKIAWGYDKEKGILQHGHVWDLGIFEPDATLLEENECLAQYRKAVKFHEIKKRRNVPSIEPEIPLLVKLGIGTNTTPLLDYLVQHSAFLMEPFHGDAAENIRTIDGRIDAKAYLLAKFAEAKFPVFEIDDPDDLPFS